MCNLLALPRMEISKEAIALRLVNLCANLSVSFIQLINSFRIRFTSQQQKSFEIL